MHSKQILQLFLLFLECYVVHDDTLCVVFRAHCLEALQRRFLGIFVYSSNILRTHKDACLINVVEISVHDATLPFVPIG